MVLASRLLPNVISEPLHLQVCEAVSLRAANLCAVGIVAVAKRISKNRGCKRITVGVDGSVYRKHPT